MTQATEVDEFELEETEGQPEEEIEELHYEISAYPADYTLKVLYDKWKSRQLVIPDFQRSYVWTKSQASRLIESFLLGLPVPGIFLYKESASQKLLVIDGHQRLGSIAYFMDGVFKDEKVFRLSGVDRRWDGKSYTELSEPDRIRLDDSVLRATVIQQLDPGDHSSVYLIFERLNTGGTKLNPMEIRKCLYIDGAYQLLEELNMSKEWRELIGRPKPDPRLKDVELVLRVLAMARKWRQYEKPMKQFLTDYMRSLQGPGMLEARLADRETFMRACRIAHAALGERPFHVRSRLNLAVLDSTLATIAHLADDRVEGLAERFAAMLADESYESATRFNTSDADEVGTRFKIASATLL